MSARRLVTQDQREVAKRFVSLAYWAAVARHDGDEAEAEKLDKRAAALLLSIPESDVCVVLLLAIEASCFTLVSVNRNRNGGVLA